MSWNKAIIGYNPNDPASMNAANAIAGSRYNGGLTGDITSDFLSTLQDSYALSDATIQGMQFLSSKRYVKNQDFCRPWAVSH